MGGGGGEPGRTTCFGQQQEKNWLDWTVGCLDLHSVNEQAMEAASTSQAGFGGHGNGWRRERVRTLRAAASHGTAVRRYGSTSRGAPALSAQCPVQKVPSFLSPLFPSWLQLSSAQIGKCPFHSLPSTLSMSKVRSNLQNTNYDLERAWCWWLPSTLPCNVLSLASPLGSYCLTKDSEIETPRRKHALANAAPKVEARECGEFWDTRVTTTRGLAEHLMFNQLSARAWFRDDND